MANHPIIVYEPAQRARFRYVSDKCLYKINVSGDEKKYPQLEIPACYANQLLVIHLQQTNSDLPHFHELATDGNEDEQGRLENGVYFFEFPPANQPRSVDLKLGILVTKTKGSEGVANILHMKEEFERRCSLLKVPPETAVEDKENIPRDDEAHDVRLVMRHYNFMTRDQFRSSDSVHHNWEEIYSIENTKKPVKPDYDIKHFQDKRFSASSGGELILVCGKVEKNKAKVVLRVFDSQQKLKWKREFLPDTEDCELHGSCTFVLKVPPYKTSDINTKRVVYLSVEKRGQHIQDTINAVNQDKYIEYIPSSEWSSSASSSMSSPSYLNRLDEVSSPPAPLRPFSQNTSELTHSAIASPASAYTAASPALASSTASRNLGNTAGFAYASPNFSSAAASPSLASTAASTQLGNTAGFVYASPNFSSAAASPALASTDASTQLENAACFAFASPSFSSAAVSPALNSTAASTQLGNTAGFALASPNFSSAAGNPNFSPTAASPAPVFTAASHHLGDISSSVAVTAFVHLGATPGPSVLPTSTRNEMTDQWASSTTGHTIFEPVKFPQNASAMPPADDGGAILKVSRARSQASSTNSASKKATKAEAFSTPRSSKKTKSPLLPVSPTISHNVENLLNDCQWVTDSANGIVNFSDWRSGELEELLKRPVEESGNSQSFSQQQLQQVLPNGHDDHGQMSSGPLELLVGYESLLNVASEGAAESVLSDGMSGLSLEDSK